MTAWRLYMDGIDGMLRRAGKVVLQTTTNSVGKVLPFMPLTDNRDKPAIAYPGGDK